MLGLYKHYKGGYYLVIGVGRLSEDRDKKLVIYFSLSKFCFWLRPVDMFRGNVEVDGTEKQRFKKLLGW